jgi:hypothetical protein
MRVMPPFGTRRKLPPRITALRFVKAASEPDAAAAEFSADLFEAFRLWCWATNTRPMSQTALGRELGKLGHAVTRHRSGRKKRAGLRLKAYFRPKPQAFNSTEGDDIGKQFSPAT